MLLFLLLSEPPSPNTVRGCRNGQTNNAASGSTPGRNSIPPRVTLGREMGGVYHTDVA